MREADSGSEGNCTGGGSGLDLVGDLVGIGFEMFNSLSDSSESEMISMGCSREGRFRNRFFVDVFEASLGAVEDLVDGFSIPDSVPSPTALAGIERFFAAVARFEVLGVGPSLWLRRRFEGGASEEWALRRFRCETGSSSSDWGTSKSESSRASLNGSSTLAFGFTLSTLHSI